MRIHKYRALIKWDSANGSTHAYDSYSRNHKISCVGKEEILASSDPTFRGDKSKYNPEELFLASISSCHMLWYLHLCSSHKVSVIDYVDQASGTMVEDDADSSRFSEVILNPIVTINESDKKQLALKLHNEANKYCFIANSCNFKIKHNAQIEIEAPN